MKRARLVLAVLGGAALVAAAAVRQGDAPSPHPVAAVAPRARPAPEVREKLDFGTAFTQKELPNAQDAFGPRSWAPPPPPPPKPEDAPKPVAPPLPFSFSGVLDDAGGKTLFLARDGAVVLAHEGEAFDPAYRLVQIGTDSAVLEYIPLGEQQLLVYPK
jgi:hypothetical protein